MVLLVDERPEEVTDFRRTVPAEIFASSNDEEVKNHLRMAELAIERAKRLVENKRMLCCLWIRSRDYPEPTMPLPVKVAEL